MKSTKTPIQKSKQMIASKDVALKPNHFVGKDSTNLNQASGNTNPKVNNKKPPIKDKGVERETTVGANQFSTATNIAEYCKKMKLELDTLYCKKYNIILKKHLECDEENYKKMNLELDRLNKQFDTFNKPFDTKKDELTIKECYIEYIEKELSLDKINKDELERQYKHQDDEVNSSFSPEAEKKNLEGISTINYTDSVIFSCDYNDQVYCNGEEYSGHSEY